MFLSVLYAALLRSLYVIVHVQRTKSMIIIAEKLQHKWKTSDSACNLDVSEYKSSKRKKEIIVKDDWTDKASRPPAPENSTTGHRSNRLSLLSVKGIDGR
jgi:hypothetical protein